MKAPLAMAGLVEQQQALDDYFDALFHSESSVSAPVQDPVTETPVQLEPVTEVEPVARPRQTQELRGERADSVRVQIFIVAGLTLALPLERLQAVLENHSKISGVSNSPASVAGTVDCNGGPVSVVDTARLVLPGGRAAKLDEGVAQRCRHLLLIDDGRWALGCADIGDVVELADGEITWRTAAGKRPWLAGMAGQRRCALLDVDGLLSLLECSLA